MSPWLMVILEGGLVFGGALLFFLWQMRDLKREKEKREGRDREQVRDGME